jgi:hypothetical protein
MNEEFVYIWISQVNSINNYDKYIQVIYNKNGDMIRSQFMKDAGIKYYCEDGQEFENHESFIDIKEAFVGHSYLESFYDNLLSKLKEINILKIKSQFLIYDSENMIEFDNIPCKDNLVFIGKFKYES